MIGSPFILFFLIIVFFARFEEEAVTPSTLSLFLAVSVGTNE